jgi:Flp pilus assembly pilin Flp
MVEYVVLAVLISLAAVVAIRASGTSIKEVFCHVAHRGGDAAELQACLTGGALNKDPDSPCVSDNLEVCGLDTPQSTPNPSGTPIPACDVGVFYKYCSDSPKTIKCSRFIDNYGDCQENCSESCQDSCACSIAPEICPGNLNQLAPYIPDSCPCAYDYSACD